MKIDALISTDEQPGLIGLLIDCVASGASVGFLPPLNRSDAECYWAGVNTDLKTGSRILLVAHENGGIAGSVQLSLCSKENALHRAEIEKLMVHTSHRRSGTGRALMLKIEKIAKSRGRDLLILDTREGDISSHLYRSLNFIKAGQIPRFAINADGSFQDTTYFYKQL